MNPIGLENIGWKYYIVFCCFLVVFLGVTWWLFPETKGYSLEEIAVLFDGENAEVEDVRLDEDKILERAGVGHLESVRGEKV